MRFENHFDVDAPLDRVWNAMLDVERVAPTVPGAQVLEQTGDDAYKVAIKLKVGPMSMTYSGDVEITERDDAAHRAVMKARAKESRGQGTADADVTMELSGDDGRTSAKVTTEVQLSGKVATMGQGVLQDVSGRLVATFADNLAAMLGSEGGGPEAAEPMAPGREGPPAGPPSGAGAAAAVDAATGATGEKRAPAQPVPPPADALDLGSLGGAVIAGRLQDPRALAGMLALVAAVFYMLGRRSARS
jgi:carbon monoxide dehydrogenase subunit G